MVQSPVGVRCRDCGKGVRLPIYDVSRSLLARAILAAVAIGIGGGLAFALLGRPLLLLVSPLFYVAALAGFGYVVGEGVSRSASRKQGRALQFVAGGGMLVALVVIVNVVTYLGGFISFFDLLGAGIAIYLAITRLR